MSPSNRKLSPVINGRLAAYTALAGAALAAPAIPNADAIIVYNAVSINIPSTTFGVYLNVVSGAFTTGSSSGLTTWDVNPWSSTGLGLFNPASPAGGAYVNSTAGGSTALNLAFGTPIGPSPVSEYGSGSSASGAAQAQWNLNSSNNLIGFRFVDATLGAGTFYGWMRISLGATPGGQPRSIVEYAYENTAGTPIAAGVPEPATMALLGVMAAGALGVRAWRKRKAA